jgi:hypothetical protein
VWKRHVAELLPEHFVGSLGHSVHVPVTPHAGAVAAVQPRSPEQSRNPRESHAGVQVSVLLWLVSVVGYW